MLQSINMLKKLTKKQWIIIGLLSLIIVLSILFRPKRAIKPIPTSTDIPSFFQTTQSLTPGVETKNQIVYPESAVTYKPLALNEKVVNDFFRPITASLNITAAPTSKEINGYQYLLWRQNNNYIDVILNNGWFNLRTNKQLDPQLQSLIELDLQKSAENWLKTNKLLNDDYEIDTEYLTSFGGQMETATNSASAQYLRFSVTPKINGLPLFSPDEKAPITIIFDNQGNLFSLNYQLPLTFFSQQDNIRANTEKIKSAKQINEAITNNQAVISQIVYPESVIISPEDNLISIKYTPEALGYLASAKESLIIPVIKLSGSVTTEDNNTTQVTAYLPALAQ